MIDFEKHKHVIHEYWDQFKPLNAFGCDFESSFHGTLFRLPLRTEKQSSMSVISDTSHSADSVGKLLNEFSSNASSMLLFLKNIESISIYEWRNGEEQPLRLSSSRIVNISSSLRAQRRYVIDTMSKLSHLNEPILVSTVDYKLSIENTILDDTKEKEEWLVCNQVSLLLVLVVTGV